MRRWANIFVMLAISLLASASVERSNMRYSLSDRIRRRKMRYEENLFKEQDRQKQVQIEDRLIRDVQQVRDTLLKSPWTRQETSNSPAISNKKGASNELVNHRAKKHKWLFSFIALLVIGGLVWWVRVSTEGNEEK